MADNSSATMPIMMTESNIGTLGIAMLKPTAKASTGSERQDHQNPSGGWILIEGFTIFIQSGTDKVDAHITQQGKSNPVAKLFDERTTVSPASQPKAVIPDWKIPKWAARRIFPCRVLICPAVPIPSETASAWHPSDVLREVDWRN